MNPFLLDFFSLARGYGLALGFQLCSLYYLLLFIKEHKQRDGFIALAIGALTVLSSFTLLNFWLVLFGIVSLTPFLFKQLYPQRRNVIYNFIIAFGLVAVIWTPVKKLQEGGSLFYGGNAGFYNNTLVSLAKYTGYSHVATPGIYAALNAFLTVFLLIVIFAFYFRRWLHTVKNVLLALLLLCCAAIILQHVLLGTLYVIDRTALYLVPLFILVLCFSLDDLPRNGVVKVLSAGIVVAFGLNFFARANWNKAALWSFNAPTGEILQMLNEQGKRSKKVLLLDYPWIFDNVFKKYAATGRYPWVKIVEKVNDQEIVKSDYYVQLSQRLPECSYFPENMEEKFPRKTIVRAFPGEQVVVYKLNE